MKITNNADVCLPLAVWLVHDEYDYNFDPNYISVTTLMKPVRQIVLPARIPPEQRSMDVMDLVASSMGHAIHNSIEKAWTHGFGPALKKLGYPDTVIERIRINPAPEELRASNSIIPVYLEQRATRPFEDFTIGGKFDIVTEGIVQDFKSTSVYTWLHGSRDDEHQLQGSLYRWIDAAQPHRKITEDFMQVNYVFTDWSKAQGRYDPRYPKRVEQKTIPLLSLDETEAWVRAKLAAIRLARTLPEPKIVHCTDEELWRSAPVHKYFADPAKANDPLARSTKNFENLSEAQAFQREKGKGVVITKPGEPKRCNYCAAFEGCSQKNGYFA